MMEKTYASEKNWPFRRCVRIAVAVPLLCFISRLFGFRSTCENTLHSNVYFVGGETVIWRQNDKYTIEMCGVDSKMQF